MTNYQIKPWPWREDRPLGVLVTDPKTGISTACCEWASRVKNIERALRDLQRIVSVHDRHAS